MLYLKTALRLPPIPRLALVGSGGKTTALFEIARQFAGPVLLTTTTHLAIEQVGLADHYYEAGSPELIQLLGAAPLPGITLVAGPPDGEGRVTGLDPGSLEQIREAADRWQAPLLIEADGSQRRPLKAPGDHEPAIPQFADQVVIVAGLSGLERPLTSEWVHRPERFAVLSGLSIGDPITTKALASVLVHPKGGFKNITPGTLRRVLLTQANSPDLLSKASSLAHGLLTQIPGIVIASSRPYPETRLNLAPHGEFGAQEAVKVESIIEPVAGIVLAAGASLRMGQPKALLDWRGQPFVRSVARTALSAGLSPVVVVTGAEALAVGSAVEDLNLRVVVNPEWETGQASSLRAGLHAIYEEIGAAVFMLADQPQIPASLVRSLIERHAVTLAPIVAPQAAGRRANPVLFDRITFPHLEGLSGDTGGRSLFSHYPIEWLEWHEENILLDVDTPEDYQMLLNLP